MNNLDKQYQGLLQDILENGVEKKDRTGTGTISVFGRQIRHKMSEGFPLLTTKKMPFKTLVTELLWFLRGDTNIKYLVDNNCHIWDGDAYKNYEMNWLKENPPFAGPYADPLLTQGEFINKIKTEDEFAKKWGELGPIYGKQWRGFSYVDKGDFINTDNSDDPLVGGRGLFYQPNEVDQIQNLIEDLKTNPDSRRLMVTAWNPGQLEEMVLPPCHYGFQVYTRELSLNDRVLEFANRDLDPSEFRRGGNYGIVIPQEKTLEVLDKHNIPTRAISLMWNQRSVDTFLGLPFNIASYGLLLEIIAKAVNMVPDELIGNLGDVHLYSNHVEQAKEQIGRELTWEEKIQWVMKHTDVELENLYITEAAASLKRGTREPFDLPTLKLGKTDHFWTNVLGEDFNMITHLDPTDFSVENYQSHPTIKAPLSN